MHITALFIEYILLPALFILLPRINHVFYDFSHFKNKDIWDNWPWKMELALAFLLSYLAILFRFHFDGINGIYILLLFLFILLLIWYYSKKYVNKIDKLVNENTIPSLIFFVNIFILIEHEYNFDKNVLFKYYNYFPYLFGIFILYILYHIFKTWRNNRIYENKTTHEIQNLSKDKIGEILKKSPDWFQNMETENNNSKKFPDFSLFASKLMKYSDFFNDNGSYKDAIEVVDKIILDSEFINQPEILKTSIIAYKFDLLIKSQLFKEANSLLGDIQNPDIRLRYWDKLKSRI